MTRRTALSTGAGLLAAPALGQPAWEPGLSGHVKGPPVWRDYDQAELDAAYDQEAYQPHTDVVNGRLSSLSFDVRIRRGWPERIAYGDHPDEGLDLYRATRPGGPVFVFIHGGIWRFLDAAMSGFAAEMFLDRGAHFVALDFSDVAERDGDLGVLADQVQRGIAWVARNAPAFGGDPTRIHVGGHSSGGHLCAVALATDWPGRFGLPPDVIKGGLCMSGMYDLEPVRLSWRSRYIAFTDALEAALSPQRHVGRITAPVVVSYGTRETPEFQRQARDFAAALEGAGKPVRVVIGQDYFHQDMWETLGNPYGPNGRAALELMGLGG
ncbi:alpha/beta hydrolase [Rubellimicrobium arenae]|uniref:alpha/beta hydrolase n=1 Tax=Rubellimicrobium arenae TaxID=2817372 RepID=UPI001B30AEAA|nr:alpha/beta hydrolase [Rubellimicrobium arenae]